MDETQQPIPASDSTIAFSIDKIYVKDLSLECPGSPQSFKTTEQPQVEVGLRTRGEQIEPDMYECVLTITLTAKTSDRTLFLVEASQAGIFTIRGVPPEHLQPV
ncbi:MAG: protein-export chaperone SecB, partial [Casimicrobiaceae bacterium]